MSLQVWLPLNGNLNNQGINSCTITNSSATVVSAGKIGSCYKGAISLTNLSTDLTATNMSISFWVKTDSNSTWQNIISLRNSSGSQLHGIYIADNTRVKYEYNPSLNLYATNTSWHHYTFIITNGASLGYLDGVLCTSSTESVTSDVISQFVIGSSNVYLNDVRIYDHCLSVKEVEELAKGLVVHYKLEGRAGAGDNIGGTSADYSNMTEGQSYSLSGWGGDAGTVQFYHSGGYQGLPYKVYHRTATGSGGVYYKTANDIILENSTTYTMSIWIKASRNFTDNAYNFNINRGSDNLYINYGNSLSITTSWQQFVKTFTTSDSGAGSYGEMGIIYEDGATAYDIYFSGFKIEKGDIATAWTPPVTSSMLTEYDCSGYEYNGTYNTAPTTLSKKEGRYAAATKFTRGATALTSINPAFITAGTLAIWVKIDTLGSSGWLPFAGQSGSYYVLATSSGTGNFYNGGTSGTITYYEDGVAVTAPTGLTTGWHHIAITGINLSSWTTLLLNAYSSVGSTAWNSTVNYSDMRLYSTVLSASQIKELYNTSATVDKNGNFYAREIVEV